MRIASGGVATAGTYAPNAEPVLIFASGSHRDVAPIGGISGSFTGIDFSAKAIAIGPSGP
jgi:hypothetical protein